MHKHIHPRVNPPLVRQKWTPSLSQLPEQNEILLNDSLKSPSTSSTSTSRGEAETKQEIEENIMKKPHSVFQPPRLPFYALTHDASAMEHWVYLKWMQLNSIYYSERPFRLMECFVEISMLLSTLAKHQGCSRLRGCLHFFFAVIQFVLQQWESAHQWLCQAVRWNPSLKPLAFIDTDAHFHCLSFPHPIVSQHAAPSWIISSESLSWPNRSSAAASHFHHVAQACSSLITLRNNHIYVTQNIMEGQVLWNEIPLLVGSCFGCHHCGQFPMWVKCRRDCGMTFCSLSCEKTAWNQYHGALCTPEFYEGWVEIQLLLAGQTKESETQWSLLVLKCIGILCTTMTSCTTQTSLGYTNVPIWAQPPFCYLPLRHRSFTIHEMFRLFRHVFEGNLASRCSLHLGLDWLLHVATLVSSFPIPFGLHSFVMGDLCSLISIQDSAHNAKIIYDEGHIQVVATRAILAGEEIITFRSIGANLLTRNKELAQETTMDKE